MSANAPTITLSPAQLAAVASFLLENPAVARAYGLAPAEAGVPLADRPETRTYHLGATPTRGRGYDDRLTVRLGPSRSKLLEELALWTEFGGRRGGLPHKRIGVSYWVSETDCRAYLNASRASSLSAINPKALVASCLLMASKSVKFTDLKSASLSMKNTNLV